ncbi:CcdC family protein [Brevibacillus centrosporus]|uniref:Membrane protein CcdC involved in cytochrome C biogenesis n=1 Tax=Brevibacillus centrosporus TaxID=54910 RepID=A0A1I3T5M3_9BACL|nr:cytochrome c biogenesis protein CcdC [Brevibacillus centrosporus]MEC2128259.1 cytochrome c biogenesis protein CcdC [Brevibacillus centrosporus]MED1953897.1 cytochrome c biogenesis protein CcdC [Brevibacillus centrosporus]MED4909680.1 cytochrome c biogenesis protein CcdC [Brevibacillus centrosporus]RNB73886.1 cytochrome c biogenesis protein CcdC [Brevibacillus centrosporus]SFJ65812.1 Membrane protein CcdC involved in cytochrome C biogenesis [Brevibacillus centrosporus]
MQILSSTALGILVPLIMATVVIFLRMRRQKKPVSAKSIILPPFFMATGFAMFFFPEAATPPMYDFTAFLVGVVFSVPLIMTSRFEIVGQDVYLKRSKAFFIILMGLLIIRLIIKLVINDSFTPIQTGGLFFLLAFGMLVPWRIAMLYMYRQLTKKTYGT